MVIYWKIRVWENETLRYLIKAIFTNYERNSINVKNILFVGKSNELVKPILVDIIDMYIIESNVHTYIWTHFSIIYPFPVVSKQKVNPVEKEKSRWHRKNLFSRTHNFYAIEFISSSTCMKICDRREIRWRCLATKQKHEYIKFKVESSKSHRAFY